MPASSQAIQAFGRSTGDQSLTSQTAMQNVTGHSFAIAANQEWLVDFDLDLGAALATTGIKLGANAPAGATLNFAADISASVVTALNVLMRRTTTIAAALDFTAATLVAMTDTSVRANLWILNGATAGTVQLQFAQSTSSGTAITVRKGSCMRAFRIA